MFSSILQRLRAADTFPLNRKAVDAARDMLLDPARSGHLVGKRFEPPADRRLASDPFSAEYKAAQLEIWSRITGLGTYEPLRNEDTPEVAALDWVKRPGIYVTGNTALIGDHLIAIGNVVRLSNLKEGQRALEYGAGFGLVALALARSGVLVDTVDVNHAFVSGVAEMGSRYGVPLRARQGVFGDAPEDRAGAYDLIYFYESFHHCLEFTNLVPRLNHLLAPGGRIILAGEPVVEDDSNLVPYPWGIRLDAENVAVVRHRGWMELGFRESFLVSLFERSGFAWSKHVMPGAHHATAYVFVRQ